MDTLKELNDIACRLDHIESAGEWLARCLVTQDTPASQTGSLIVALAEDIRNKVVDLVTQLEKEVERNAMMTSLQ